MLNLNQRAELAELTNRLEKNSRFTPEKVLFRQQQEFINHPARAKAGVCSRRAGKTYAVASYLVQEALAADFVNCLYIALTRRSAKLLLWSQLEKFNREYGLDCQFNNSDLIATFPNGSKILLTGAEDESQIEKLRGMAYKLAVIDEAGSFRQHIIALIEEVLEPALIDLRGTLCLIGTPNASCTGYFHDATNGIVQGWEVFQWTILDNPHIPHAEQELEEKKKQKGWDESNPVFQREWRGRWIRSTDSLVYHFERLRNTCGANAFLDLWKSDCNYILGIDLGFDDATAFVVVGFSRDSQVAFVVDGFKRAKMVPDEIAGVVKTLDAKYHFLRVVVDTGGLGKMIVEEMNRRHGLQLKPAEKQHKFDFIELLNDDLRLGRLQVVTPQMECLCEEWELLQYDEDRLKEADQYENHLADACLYAWRESRHYLNEAKIVEPPRGSDAWYEMEADDMFVTDRERLQEEQQKAFWEL